MAEPTPFLAVVYSDATWWIIYLFFYLVLIYRLVRLRLRDWRCYDPRCHAASSLAPRACGIILRGPGWIMRRHKS